MSEPTLIELRDAHQAAWEALLALPIETRREGAGNREWKALHDRIDDLYRQMVAHPDWRDFEGDLAEALAERIKADDAFAGATYAALCNVDWGHEKGSTYSCSWRYAGGLIAQIRGEGDYLNWYCYGGEGEVADEIETAMAEKGWTHDADPVDVHEMV